MRFRPRTTLAALGAVAALSTGALVLGGVAAADPAGPAASPATIVQVQQTTPSPDSPSERDCPQRDGAGTGGDPAEQPAQPSADAVSTRL